MADDRARIDSNYKKTLLAVTDDVAKEIRNLLVDPVTGRLKCVASGASGVGITSLNGLVAATQTFATGTIGTDFGISSVGTVHTFNLPTASASNRGLLSTTDWSTFNGKQDSLGLTNPGANVLAGWDNTDSAWHWITLGTNLTYTHSSHTLSATGGGHTIQDEGTPLTQRANLNFAGAGVTATDDAGNNATLITIPGGGGGTPASPNTSVQYNNGGAFGGSSTLLYDSTNRIITFGLEYDYGTIQAPNAITADTRGGGLIINTGDGTGSEYGGSFTINGGNGVRPGELLFNSGASQLAVTSIRIQVVPASGYNFAIGDPITTYAALFDTHLIGTTATTDRTFTFPDQTGTLYSLPDPEANTIAGWDETDNLPVNITIGTGLSYDHSSHTLSAASATQLPVYNAPDGNPGTDVYITGGNALSGNNNAGLVELSGGVGSGSGKGGDSGIFGGEGGDMGNGGGIGIQGGDGGATSGNGGFINIKGGDALGGDSNGGGVIIMGGLSSGAGIGGAVGIANNSGSLTAHFDTSLLATTDKTFQFPNNSGVFALTSQLPTPAALTKVDDTNVTLTLGGTPTTALLQATSLTLGWSGTLAIGRGGTGASTKSTAFDALSPMSAAGDIIYGGASGTGTRLAIGGANTVLHGGVSVPAYSAVVEADISLSANTTNNVSTTKHGFAPQLSNLTTQFLRGDGAWAVPAGATLPNAYLSESFAYTANTPHSIVHNFGTFPLVQAFDSSGYQVVPYIVYQSDVNTTQITFTASATYTIILTLGSPQLTAYTATSGNYAMLAGDYLIEETGASKIVTLLTPVGRSGKTVIIKNSSAGVCDVQTAAGTIDGYADITLVAGDSLTVVSNNTNWLII